jgi:hypothetical protein
VVVVGWGLSGVPVLMRPREAYDASNRTYVEPKLMMSPSLSAVSPWIRVPFTIVPFVDPRSTTT